MLGIQDMNFISNARPVICSKCENRFYCSETCSVCHEIICPVCGSCSCKKLGTLVDEKHKTEKSTFTELKSLEEVHYSKTRHNLIIEGILSPLQGQEIVKTRKGKALLSHYTITDGFTVIPLKIWGKLPDNLYKNRYSSLKVRIQGVKISSFNSQDQLVLQRNARIKLLGTRTKPSLKDLIQDSQNLKHRMK